MQLSLTLDGTIRKNATSADRCPGKTMLVKEQYLLEKKYYFHQQCEQNIPKFFRSAPNCGCGLRIPAKIKQTYL